jgi:DNA-binding NarL/FixJ family response regulator
VSCLEKARSSVSRIRVLLVQLTGVLGEVVRGVIDQQADIEIVREVAHAPDARAAVFAEKFDLIVWRTDGVDAADVAALLQGNAPPKVLTVEDDGRGASVWQLRAEQMAIGQVSPDSLVQAIRRVYREGLDPEVGHDV